MSNVEPDWLAQTVGPVAPTRTEAVAQAISPTFVDQSLDAAIARESERIAAWQAWQAQQTAVLQPTAQPETETTTGVVVQPDGTVAVIVTERPRHRVPDDGALRKAAQAKTKSVMRKCRPLPRQGQRHRREHRPAARRRTSRGSPKSADGSSGDGPLARRAA